jgi:hypothetical protein
VYVSTHKQLGCWISGFRRGIHEISFLAILHKNPKRAQIAAYKGKAVPLQAWTGPEGCRGIALPFRNLGSKGGVWSASRTGRFTPAKDPVPIVQEDG